MDFQVSVTSGSTASSRPLGTSATSTISQSVLLSGTAGGQGQMYLRVGFIRRFTWHNGPVYRCDPCLSPPPPGQPLPQGSHLLPADLHAQQHRNCSRGSSAAAAGGDSCFVLQQPDRQRPGLCHQIMEFKRCVTSLCSWLLFILVGAESGHEGCVQSQRCGCENWSPREERCRWSSWFY